MKKGFFNLGNIVISSDYSIDDSISFTLKDNSDYTILLLIPEVNYSEDKALTGCRNSKNNKRLFLLLSRDNGKYKTKLLSEKLMINPSDFFEFYEHVKNDTDGFKITCYAMVPGAMRCNYTFHFRYADTGFVLRSSDFQCHAPDLSKSKKAR